MVDAEEVRTLLGQYCERIDLGDFDGVGKLFADGGLADEHGNVLARGQRRWPGSTGPARSCTTAPRGRSTS